MSDTPIHVWHHIVPPVDGSEDPEWAAWVNADDANWGTLRIIHLPSQKITIEEPVSLTLDMSAFLTGKASEDEWLETVNNYVAQHG